MLHKDARSSDRENVPAALLVLGAALALAVVGARPFTAWNDASRLAMVESLVDHHALAIDRSIFRGPAGGDKLFVEGHYYSDKPPVPTLLMAGYYQVLQWATGLEARQRPDAFGRRMALAGAGLAYVVAVWCIFRLTGVLRLPLADRLMLTAVFALGTLAPVYARQVNGHIELLAVAAALFLGLARLAARGPAGQSWPRLLGLGCLAGLGYTTDLGAGPALLVGTLGWVAGRCRSKSAVAGFVLGAAPWLVLHHAVNYAIGGTFGPANAVPAYFTWPGCPFRPEDLTGAWNHPGLLGFLSYAGGFLVGPRGFLNYNLPLMLAVPGLVVLLWRRVAEWPELLLAAFWAGGTWLLYAVASTNYSGLCFSVRWLVPLLAPGFLVLAILLREFPRRRAGLLVLGGWGVVLTALMWPDATWYGQEVEFFWPVQAGALVSWLGCEAGLWWRARRRQREGGGALPRPGILGADGDRVGRAA